MFVVSCVLIPFLCFLSFPWLSSLCPFFALFISCQFWFDFCIFQRLFWLVAIPCGGANMHNCPDSLDRKPKLSITNTLEPGSPQCGDGAHAGDFNHKPVSRPDEVRLVFVTTRNEQLRLKYAPLPLTGLPQKLWTTEFFLFWKRREATKLTCYLSVFASEKIHARIGKIICSMFGLLACAASNEIVFSKAQFFIWLSSIPKCTLEVLPHANSNCQCSVAAAQRGGGVILSFAFAQNSVLCLPSWLCFSINIATLRKKHTIQWNRPLACSVRGIKRPVKHTTIQLRKQMLTTTYVDSFHCPHLPG